MQRLQALELANAVGFHRNVRRVGSNLIRCASKGKRNLFRFDFLTCVT